MKYIEKLHDEICEELEGACHYAEKYIKHKARGEMDWANKFHEMATDELKHAKYLHEHLLLKTEKIKSVYNPPVEMEERLDSLNKHFAEKTAIIKKMLEN